MNDGWAREDPIAHDVLIGRQGPGSVYLGAALDSADLYDVLDFYLR